jgi:D-lactate dehydrogenase (cytochrome)
MSAPKFYTSVDKEFPDFLRDESRRSGRADSISFPNDEADIRNTIMHFAPLSVPITVQGARTGITAGAVPDSGHIMNLSRMNNITGMRHNTSDDSFCIEVQPGVILKELKAAIAGKIFTTTGWSKESMAALKDLKKAPNVFFPPDPTEESASIGGLVSCNASGACSFLYGPTRRHIEALRVILPDGDILVLRRGEQRAAGRSFNVTTSSGRTISGNLPTYKLPLVKNASGYHVADNMDLVDLFIGAEGTLGIVSSMELRLSIEPAFRSGVVAFFPEESGAVTFVENARSLHPRPAAIEFFDSRALDLLRSQRANNPGFAAFPDLPIGLLTAVYVEFHGSDEAVMDDSLMSIADLITANGGDVDMTWGASEPSELKSLKTFRHAVPESVNMLIDQRRKTEPKLSKLGTDLAVPDAAWKDVVAMYHAGLDKLGLEYVMFGHAGNNHLHINIIPRDMSEYDRGRQLYMEWARKVVSQGGSISAEHGVGKMKTALLAEMYGPEGIREMIDVKSCFDPNWLLNPGNLFTKPS